MAKLAVAVAALAHEAAGVILRSSRQSERATLETYTFEDYAKEFGRATPASGSEEYHLRVSLFQEAVHRIQATNARNVKEGRSWKAGAHPFMDWTDQEKKTLNGYKPSRGKHGVSFLSDKMKAFSNATRTSNFDETAEEGGLLAIDAGPPLRDQGNCGSCWAISAAEAVEAQLQRSGAFTQKVAAQALVDCVPNPQHCGGSGGCDGATGELAYSYMRDHGIPLEQDLKYTAKTGKCTPQAVTGDYPAASRVRVSGWNALPSNKAKPLMEALATQGPAVVAVDGNSWFDYSAGVFDGCDKDAIIGHAVLAKGYGKDAASGKMFWLIQNSWGSQWGESGHIRLLRRDDDDSYCGTDNKPKEGLGCDGGPESVTVCGTCGVLFDSLVPQGVHVETSGTSFVSFADEVRQMPL